MQAFDITAQTGDVLAAGQRQRAEAQFLVANRLGRRVRAEFQVRPAGESETDMSWLTVQPSTHNFAAGGSVIVRVAAEIPADADPGRYGFALAATAESDLDAATTGAPVWLQVADARSNLVRTIAIAASSVLVLGLGLYWLVLAPPACETGRAVYDRSAGECVCPSGMTEATLGDERICACNAGTSFDDASGRCVARACDTERALYAEVVAACTCPPGTREVALATGRKCVCSAGKRFDDQSLTCQAHTCDEPQGGLYSDIEDKCVCPEGSLLIPADDSGPARCGCPTGQAYLAEERRCGSIADLSVEVVQLFPPLIRNRRFHAYVTVTNKGEQAAGTFRIEVDIDTGGPLISKSEAHESLAAGSSTIFDIPELRTRGTNDVRLEVRIVALDFEDGDSANNRFEKVYEVAYSRRELTAPSDE